MVQYKESVIKCCNNKHEIKAVEYHPDNGPPKAALCWHHGVAEHVGRYKDVFTALANQGISVFAYDAVGHGNSSGTRLYIDRFSDLVNQLKATCAEAKRECAQRSSQDGGQVPVFLGGQSLGGLVATVTCYEIQDDFAGLVLVAPSLDVHMTPILKVQAAMGNFLASILPKARIVPAVDPTFLNRDPAAVQAYLDDPLCTPGPLPARTGNEALKMFRWLRGHYSDYTLPIYAIHGTGDRVTDPEGTKAFMEGASSRDKTLVQPEGAYHEPLFEAGGDQLVADVAAWVLDRGEKWRSESTKGGGSNGSKL